MWELLVAVPSPQLLGTAASILALVQASKGTVGAVHGPFAGPGQSDISRLLLIYEGAYVSSSCLVQVKASCS